MPKPNRRQAVLGGLSLLSIAALGLSAKHAAAQVYYDQYGNQVTINVYTITTPVTVYDVYRRPVVIYPAAPAYVPGPATLGPASVAGQSRRVARRTARRTSRRW